MIGCTVYKTLANPTAIQDGDSRDAAAAARSLPCLQERGPSLEGMHPLHTFLAIDLGLMTNCHCFHTPTGSRTERSRCCTKGLQQSLAIEVSMKNRH